MESPLGAVEFALACAKSNPALSADANKERRNDCYQVAIEALFTAQARFGKGKFDVIIYISVSVCVCRGQVVKGGGKQQTDSDALLFESWLMWAPFKDSTNMTMTTAKLHLPP